MSVLSCRVSQVPCLLQWLILWSLLDDLNCLPCLTLSGGWVHSWCCGHFLASMQPVGKPLDLIQLDPSICRVISFLLPLFLFVLGSKSGSHAGLKSKQPTPEGSQSWVVYTFKVLFKIFFFNLSQVAMFWFFFFHVSFIIFYLFQSGVHRPGKLFQQKTH